MTTVAASVSTAAQAPTKETWSSDSRFYLTLVLISALLIFIGFAPSFYLKTVIDAPAPPLTSLTMTHGVVYTAWMVVVIAQAGFIAANKPAPHRTLGMLGVLLFGVVFTVGLSTAITAARLGHAPPFAPQQPYFLALPAIGIVVVLGLIIAAVSLRRRPDWHKRLMLAAFFMMTQPGTARLAFPLNIAERGILFSFLAMEGLLAVAIFYDWRKYRRIHPAYVVSAAVFAAFHIIVYWAFSSPLWRDFANAIIGAGNPAVQ
ncbi:MAG: hypothetical protein AB7F91_06000 [Parvularculaceae bacterium]